ncbi:MAG: ion channel [bacterium]
MKPVLLKYRTLLLLSVALGSLVLLGGLFWHYEHGINPHVENAFDVVWWWVVTSATVGYGDIVPMTWEGRVASIVVILTGVFIYAIFVAIIVEMAYTFVEGRQRGMAQVKVSHHIVICEYTAIADELIQALPQCQALAKLPVAIITELVSETPYPQHEFVCGVPINPAVLRRANVAKADYIFIFANMRFATPDVKTLHVASRIMELNPSAQILVELIDPHTDLLRYLPRKPVVMDSRLILEMVLRKGTLDPSAWIAGAGAAG